jgi:rhomboid protease GluP
MNQSYPEPGSYPGPAGQQPSPVTPPPPEERQPVMVRLELPQIRPTVTYTLLVVTVIIFGLQQLSLALFGQDYPLLLGAKVNEAIQAGEFWRLITPLFLHDDSTILHIGFNMYALFVLGPGLERYYGHNRFLILYFLAGLAGNVASMIFSPIPSIGASTAIFGLIAAQGIFILKNRFLYGKRAGSMLINVLVIVLINLGIGLRLSSQIDNWGHLGGLIGGLGFSWFAGPIFQVKGQVPSLRIEDQSNTSQTWLIGLIELLGLCLLTFLKLVRVF